MAASAATGPALSVLHTAAARVGALDLGFVPGAGGLDAHDIAKAGALDVVFLLGADEIDVEPGAFVVYIGSHGDRGAHRADVILPGAAYTEKSGLFVNTEGPRADVRPRRLPARRRARGLGDLPRAVRRARQALAVRLAGAVARRCSAAHPHLARIDAIERGDRRLGVDVGATVVGRWGRALWSRASPIST